MNQQQTKYIEVFGYSGTNQMFDLTIELLEDYLQAEYDAAVSRDTLGEARIHAAGRAEGVANVIAALVQLRQECRELNGSLN
jgi:hypothetical protein